MPIIKNIPIISVTDGTNGYIIDISDVEEYRISGTETLTTNWDLVLRDRTGVGVGTPSTGMFVRFFFDADITLGGNTITILGTSMPDAYVTKESTIEAYYDGSNWIVKFFVDDDEDSTISTDNIEDKAITKDKIEDLTYGSILAGNSSARPVEVSNGTGGYAMIVSQSSGATSFMSLTNGNVLLDGGDNALLVDYDTINQQHIMSSALGNGLTGGSGVVISVDPDTTNGTSITSTSDGVALDGDEASPGVGKYYGTDSLGDKGWQDMSTSLYYSTTISGTDIDTGNSVPIELIGSPGSGKAILIEDFVVRPSTIGGASSGNTTLQLISDGATVAQYEETRALLCSVTTATHAYIGTKVTATAATDLQVLANASVFLKVKTGDPTTGTPASKNQTVFIKYRIIEF